MVFYFIMDVSRGGSICKSCCNSVKNCTKMSEGLRKIFQVLDKNEQGRRQGDAHLPSKIRNSI